LFFIGVSPSDSGPGTTPWPHPDRDEKS
jgi:hypothetical protein